MPRLYNDDDPNYSGWDEDDRSMFADPGGRSALRAAHKGNPRNRSCPTCKRRNVLTRRTWLEAISATDALTMQNQADTNEVQGSNPK